MKILLTSIFFIFIVGCLPYALLMFYRNRRPLALVMVIGSILVWGGTIAIFTAEPTQVSSQHGKEPVAFKSYERRSEKGEYALVGGAILVLLSGSILKLGNGASKRSDA